MWMYLQTADAVQAAVRHLEGGGFAGARVLLEQAVQARPKYGLAWAALARAYLGLGMKEQAARAARHAGPLVSGDPEAEHTLALYFAQSGDRKRAAEYETRYARSARADDAAAARAAMLNAEVGQWEPAIEFGRKALEKGQRPDLLLPMLARAYETTGRMDEAIEMRRKHAAAMPYDEEAQSSLGIALLRAARFREAVEHLETARRVFARSPQMELALGTGYYSQRRFAEAGAAFLRVIALDPAVHQPYIFLARMIDQIPERAAEFQTVAKAWFESPTRHPFAPYVYAKSLATAGAGDSAIRPLIDEALRRDPKVWEFHFESGQLMEQARDFAAAAKAYEAAAACEPQRPEPHYRLARMYDRLGRAADAKRQRELHAELTKKQKPAGGMASGPP
jgi:tetratricopeptide (TPR) repeat protein